MATAKKKIVIKRMGIVKAHWGGYWGELRDEAEV